MSTKAQTFRLAAFLALRIAKSRSKNALSVVTALSVIGVACGVFALTVVLAVSDGFEKAFQDRILGIYPHLMVTRTQSVFHDWEGVLRDIQATPGVTGATPFSHHRMMASSGPFRAEASIQGVDPKTLSSVIELATILKEGDLSRLDEKVTVSVSRTSGGHVLTLAGLIVGSAQTIVLLPGSTHEVAPRTVVFDGHLRPPAAGQVSLTALDFRPAETRAPIRLSARAARSDSVTIGADDTAPSAEVTLDAGLFTLDVTTETLELAPDHQYVLIVYDTPSGPSALLLGDVPPRVPAQGRAYVRAADLRPTGAPVQLVSTRSSRPFATTDPESGALYTPLLAADDELPTIFLGKALAKKLRAGVGDVVSFVTMLRTFGGSGFSGFGAQPSAIRFTIAGIFESGFYEQDVSLAITHLYNSERFMGAANVVEAIAVRTEDVLTLDRTKNLVKRALDPLDFEDLLTQAIGLEETLKTVAKMGDNSPLSTPTTTSPFIDQMENAAQVVDILGFHGTDRATFAQFRIYDWRDKNANHLSVIELQKIVLTIFFLIIVLVGSFVVVGSQIMIINEKTADIAILKTIGATGPFIRLVFTLQGLFVAVIGVIAGLVAGLGAVWLLDAVDYELEASIYFIDRLPVDVHPFALVLVALGTLACTLLTTQISAARAAAKEPVAGLRQVD